MNSVNTDINEEVLMNRMWISVGHFIGTLDINSYCGRKISLILSHLQQETTVEKVAKYRQIFSDMCS